MTKTALDNALRSKYVENLIHNYSEFGEDVQRISGNVIAFPVTDDEGNDAWIEITVKVPKGERIPGGGGYMGYDGYTLAENYQTESLRKAAEASARKAKADAKKQAKGE